jgi:hypothetical protein
VRPPPDKSPAGSQEKRYDYIGLYASKGNRAGWYGSGQLLDTIQLGLDRRRPKPYLRKGYKQVRNYNPRRGTGHPDAGAVVE